MVKRILNEGVGGRLQVSARGINLKGVEDISKIISLCINFLLEIHVGEVKAPGGGVLPEKLGGDVRPASQNPYPIYDQDLRYSLPYL